MKTTMLAATAAIASTAMGAQFVLYTPGGDDTSVERMDSIISPGTISGHVHQIFGANKMSPNMTYDSLQDSDCTTVGNADGDGNAADKSVYWHPALYAEAKDGSGYTRIPTSGHKLYYRDVGNAADQLAEPFEFPKGFRMIAGDPTRRAAASDSQRQDITQWVCHRTSSAQEGEKGGFPSDISDCDQYPGFNGAIHFPHCWNGEDFDQSDPMGHMSYPEGDVQAGACPSSHPIRVPHIFAENFFDLHKVVDDIKPNTFVLAHGDATGFGMHFDFFNGWESGAIPQLMESCPQPYYGNDDVGTCPSFRGFSSKTSDCKLETTFEEDVDGPTQFLPGCNPVSSTNPAPKLAIAALGVSTDQCSAAGSSSDSGSDSASGYGSGSGSGSQTTTSRPATTFSTSATVVPTTTDSGNRVAWETQWVTIAVEAKRSLPSPDAVQARHEHAHLHKLHRRAGHSF